MARFINANSLTSDEIQAGIDDGSLRYCALGPANGRWLVVVEPDSDPDEIHAGLPGDDLIIASDPDAGSVEWSFNDE